VEGTSLRERLAPARTFLFTPGDHSRRIASAMSGSADVVILDLEDSVQPSQKGLARQLVQEALATIGREDQIQLVRVNVIDGRMAADDLRAAAGADGIVLPKATARSVAELPCEALVLIETALGLRETYEIALTDAVAAVALGGEDLAAELGLSPLPDETHLLAARSQLVRDCAAAGARAPIDVVDTAIGDLEGLRNSTTRARALGMHGKLCIHPAQLEVVAACFRPMPSEIEWAQKVLEHQRGHGVGSIDGTMVDEAVAKRARKILLRAQ
jgi:citrate lyase subunit beta / citryl-CoA lyase